MNSNFIDATIDTSLHNLIAEGPLFNGDFLMDAPFTTVTQSDIDALKLKMDNLTIASHTQALQIEVERVKRRKLQSSIRVMRQNSVHPRPEIMSLQQEIQAA